MTPPSSGDEESSLPPSVLEPASPLLAESTALAESSVAESVSGVAESEFVDASSVIVVPLLLFEHPANAETTAHDANASTTIMRRRGVGM
jgi:hypothetical protein